jgi:hypothetical protein
MSARVSRFRRSKTVQLARGSLAPILLGIGLATIGVGSVYYPCSGGKCVTHSKHERGDLLGFKVEMPLAIVPDKPAPADAGGEEAPSEPAPDSLQALIGADRVFLTFGNAAYWELIYNWVVSVNKTGIPFIVAGEWESMTRNAAGLAHPG